MKIIVFFFVFILSQSFQTDILIKTTEDPSLLFITIAEIMTVIGSKTYSLTSPARTFCLTLHETTVQKVNFLKTYLFSHFYVTFLSNDYSSLSLTSENSENKFETKNQEFFRKVDFFTNIPSFQGIKIAVLDSGIASNVCDNPIININFTDESETPSSDHGRLISSIICNKQYGLCKNCTVISYKIFAKDNKTKPSFIFKALDRAKVEKVKVVNLSFGGVNFDDYTIADKINELIAENIIVIAASGNDGPSFGTINFPGGHPSVITVFF